MFKSLRFLLVVLMFSTIVMAQAPRVTIKSEALSLQMLTDMGLSTNQASSGLKITANGTYFYFSAFNFGSTQPVLTKTFTLETKPAGSNATIEALNADLVGLKPDVKGAYGVRLAITTTGGSHDTLITFYSADYVGVGGFEGVAGSFPKCMTCHSSATFTEIFTRWKDSGHGQALKKPMTSGPASFGPSCLKCHTTGYDNNLVASNGGFDDVAASLGYVYSGPPNAGKWDSLKTGYPGLVNLATVGCESCHGAGSEHSMGGDPNKISNTNSSASCIKCHDAPPYYNTVAQGKLQLHNTPIWSNSFAQGAASQNNNLQNCIRCHDGTGYVNLTKNRTTNTTGWNLGNQTHISCATCHDPHGNANAHSLRSAPAAADTLANGFAYDAASLGTGKLCIDCHKSRRDNVTYTATSVTNSNWGPHYSGQGDIFMGKNLAEFGTPYPSSVHKFINNSCAGCHMVADETPANRNKVGGHTLKMHNPDNGYDFTKPCQSCHGPITSFTDVIASADHDGDGTVEPFVAEFDGLVALLKYYLPPVGLDSVSWQLIGANNNLNEKKAYFNYRLIYPDGSHGIHNPKYVIAALRKSIEMIGGIIPVELTEFKATTSNRVVTLNWSTSSETNNKGFEVERLTGEQWSVIGFVEGNGTTTELVNYQFIDKPKTSSTTVSYRIKQIDLDGSFNYSKAIEVELSAIPDAYTLNQNYPNPFNPSTKINFSIPEGNFVTLKVYDASGSEVTTLVNGQLESGYHEVIFDASKLTSGIYFYTLSAGEQKITKKMLLMK